MPVVVRVASAGILLTGSCMACSMQLLKLSSDQLVEYNLLAIEYRLHPTFPAKLIQVTTSTHEGLKPWTP